MKAAAYTTPAQIRRWHHAAEFYAATGWPDLPNPKDLKPIQPDTLRRFETHIAESPEARRTIAEENIRARATWFQQTNMVGEAASSEKMRRIESIYEYVRQNPGAMVSDLAKLIGCTEGAVTRYARILLSEKRIKGVKDKQQRYHYYAVK